MARILVLSVLLATPGCTAMVIDLYRDGAMAPSLFFWVEAYEQPEIHVSWSHFHPTKSDFLHAEISSTPLTIRPALEGCQFVEVYVNHPMLHLAEREKAVRVEAIPVDGALLPDESYPECAVLLTFRSLASPPSFALSAATRNGVVAEFPNGEREPAWLLLVPFAAVPDAVVLLMALAYPLTLMSMAAPH